MKLVVGPFHRSTTPSMLTAMQRVDICLDLIGQTGTAGLTASTATLGLNLTYLLGNDVIVTNDAQTITIIIDEQSRPLTLTGCLIQDTLHNALYPQQPHYLLAINRQLITSGDELIALIDTQLA